MDNSSQSQITELKNQVETLTVKLKEEEQNRTQLESQIVNIREESDNTKREISKSIVDINTKLKRCNNFY
tara:strand:+ start:77 stop:286 length:210 start_codon:yes stop_codon:yes gene_type:complete